MNINTPSITPEYDLDSELNKLYGSITSRSFSYNPASDPLYRSYADSYSARGRMAMRDSMGQAAALTGGYGSSYSQSVGQQQYNEYLRSLSDVLPELYDMAFSRYEAEGENLRAAYDMSWQRREDEYQRDRDQKADAAAAEEREYQRRHQAREDLIALISGSGYIPTDEDLAEVGMTREQADALRQEYLRKNKLLKKKSSSPGYTGSGEDDSSERREKKIDSGSKGGGGGGKRTEYLR